MARISSRRSLAVGCWPLAVFISPSANGQRPTANSKCVYPRSRSSSSSLRTLSSMQTRNYQIEDSVGDDDLGRARDLRLAAVAGDDQHLVLVGVEADRRIADVVGHDEVRVLTQQFLPRVVLHRVGLRGEGDHERAGG